MRTDDPLARSFLDDMCSSSDEAQSESVSSAQLVAAIETFTLAQQLQLVGKLTGNVQPEDEVTLTTARSRLYETLKAWKRNDNS